MRQVDVVGVRLELPSNQPVLILRDQQATRYLPLWIGTAEATAISLALEGVEPPRPLTHDLMKDILASLQVSVDSIHLTELRDGIFYSLINLQGGISVSSRPSDAIALALRTGSPILASEALLSDAGIEIPDQSDDEVEKFKEFLDQINPEDFLG